MTIKELAYLILKIVGIYCLIQGIFLLSTVVMGAWVLQDLETIGVWAFLGMIVYMVLMILLGVILLIFTKQIGRIIGLPELGESSEIAKIEESQAVAFSIVGLVLVATAIPKFFNIFVKTLYDSHERMMTGIGFNPLSTDNVGQMVELTVLTVLGFYLFFRAEGVARLWERCRSKRLID